MTTHTGEIKKGDRFEFGKNWKRFLAVLDDDRIGQAEKSLREMLGVESLEGKSFLDIGCGSGLFSLAARGLGASVVSFDYDPDSVACARELKRRYFPDDGSWSIGEGSALDGEYLESLGRFDVVYSWGVLHHTGRMWDACGLAAGRVKPGGQLFISIYNDQGPRSVMWRRVKKVYCSGAAGRAIVTCAFVPSIVVLGLVYDVLAGKNPVRRYTEYKQQRGMSIAHDWLDWLGGYPYEVARPEEMFEFFSARRFRLVEMKTTNSHGTNQFVFRLEA